MVRLNHIRPGSTDFTNTMRTSDFLAFTLIIFFTRKSKVPGVKVRTIWDTIAEDATRYFLVIFTSHFVFMMTLNIGRVSATIFPLWVANDDVHAFLQVTIKLLPGP